LNRVSRLASASVLVETGKEDLSRCMFWGQSMGPAAEETLKFSIQVHSEDLGVKSMSGDDV